MIKGLREFLVSASRGGGRNFRVVGGCETADGRLVARGHVFRSGHLGEIGEDTRAELGQLGLRTVVTLQTRQEIDILGDPLPELLPDVRWEHIPIGDRWFQDDVSLSDTSYSQGEFYVRMVVDHADLWVKFLRIFADRDRFSILYHCTAGRDRTGVATVLLLETLGVPRPTIVEDYLRSNDAFAESVQEATVLDPLFSRIDAAGGIDPFLDRMGLAAAEVAAVRANLLADR